MRRQKKLRKKEGRWEDGKFMQEGGQDGKYCYAPTYVS